MMRADHLIHGEIAEPQPSPGFLLAPFGWAAGPVAGMMRADRSLFADLFAIDRSRMHAGHCAVYLWEDAARPAACLTRRHGRLGWFLDEVKGPRNVEIEPDQLEVIAAAFAHVGVPSSQVVRAIENIIDGESGPLYSVGEDW
jgi:hypothetical protein